MGPSKDAISKLARQFWEKEGQPTGRDMELWLRAEKEILAAWESKPAPKTLTVATTSVPQPNSSLKGDGRASRRTSTKPFKKSVR